MLAAFRLEAAHVDVVLAAEVEAVLAFSDLDGLAVGIQRRRGLEVELRGRGVVVILFGRAQRGEAAVEIVGVAGRGL